MSEIKSLLTVLQSLLWNPGTGVLIALLIAAAWTDWRTMRIPNVLTVFGMLWGVAFNTAHRPDPLDGLLFALGGLAVGLLLLLPLWLIRVMGAGDVKLMAVVGAFVGAHAVLGAALFVFVTGGLAALGFTFARRALKRLAFNLREIAWSAALRGVPLWRGGSGESVGRMPYGVSISVGTIAFLFARQVATS